MGTVQAYFIVIIFDYQTVIYRKKKENYKTLLFLHRFITIGEVFRALQVAIWFGGGRGDHTWFEGIRASSNDNLSSLNLKPQHARIGDDTIAALHDELVARGAALQNEQRNDLGHFMDEKRGVVRLRRALRDAAIQNDFCEVEAGKNRFEFNWGS